MRNLAASCIVCLFAPLHAQPASDAASVLDQMRSASGGTAWGRVAEIVQHGTMKENGFTGQLTQGEDLKTGFYAFKADFPSVNARIGSGVHGDEIWTLNQQGDLAVHSGAHDDNGAVTDTYLYRRGYWRQGFDGAAVTMDSPVTEDGVSFDRVRITPAHGQTVVLWINGSTHLLDREQWGNAAKRYSDYRVVSGLKLPFSIGHVTNEQEDWAITLERIDVKGEVDDADVAIGFYHDFEMPPSGVVTVPTQNGIIFDAKINGKGPFKMFFDTGSINMITESVAKQIGITPEGDAKKLGAAGNGTIDARPVKIAMLQIGDVTLHDQPFQMMDFPAKPGLPVGVVGYEFMQRFVVKVDYEHNHMIMIDPARFRYDDAGIEVPMLVQSHGVFVKASVDGFKGIFALDTGNEAAFELEPGFVRVNDLVKWTNAKFRGYAGRGYAGPFPDAYYARIQKLQIGGAEVDDVTANLAGGEPHDGEPDGNIGESVLRQFNVTFDATRGKLYLKKNANWGPVPFNRAGIVTDPQDDGMKVMTVLSGSTGELAGLQAGDLITMIDGKAPDDNTDESVFQRPAGTVLHLTVSRGGNERQVAVTLKDVL